MPPPMAERKVDNPDDEFGVPAGTSSAVEGGSGSKGKGKEGEGELEFLNYVTCSICGHPFYSKNEADRKFWMTSCGHILCGSRDHNHQKGRCTKCKKEEIEAYPVDKDIHPELRIWFGRPIETAPSVLASLKRTVAELETGTLAVSTFQTQELIRLVKLLGLADERKEENIKLVKTELQKMGAMKKELIEIKAKNEELQRENDQLRLNQSQPQHRTSHIPSQYSQHTSNPLTPVVEEGEDEGFMDSGPQSVQRFEFDLAEQRPALDQFSTPRNMPSRLTLPPTDRPVSAEPYSQQRLSRSGPSRVNLEKYRNPDTGNHTTPYTRPASAMSRSGSTRPFRLAPSTAVPGLGSGNRKLPGDYIGFSPIRSGRSITPIGGNAFASSSHHQQDQSNPFAPPLQDYQHQDHSSSVYQTGGHVNGYSDYGQQHQQQDTENIDNHVQNY